MARMDPPESGVKVRMYRQGHGDCFLLAFRKSNGDPFYMLIDCGLKPGSEVHAKIKTVARDIKEATGNRLDLVVITHEHQDHVNGFLQAKDIFGAMHIEECWLAWTEDPKDRLAKRLRKDYGDTLIGLISAAQNLKGARDETSRRVGDNVRDLLGLEFNVDGENPLLARSPKSIKGITNKKAMKLIKDRAARNKGTRYLNPHRDVMDLPGDIRCFVLGPPRRESRLKDMNPRGDEEFHVAADAASQAYFSAAARHHASAASEPFGFKLANESSYAERSPFDARYAVAPSDAKAGESNGFFKRHYGFRRGSDAWRDIEHDWLRSSEQFALRMNSYVNNTSLVLAFELPQSKRVLLFVGDAQRGNWITWDDHVWTSRQGLNRGENISAKDLLGRTVLYKVGHHGSHNATLKAGGLDDMAQGDYAEEFVAMIPAHEHWAKEVKSKPWNHPLDAIHEALAEKARGRVFLSDYELERGDTALRAAEWRRFKAGVDQNDLFFEYTVGDTPR